jgi:aryl-alcohol dehydrogenase
MSTTSRTALAAVLRSGHGRFEIEELTLAEPRPDEVVVRMVAVGMCHTDLLTRELPPEFFSGAAVHGHEGAGIVEEIGADVTAVSVGDHVVLSFNSCGSCRACARGRLPYCANFTQYNMSGGRPDGTAAFTDAAGARVGSHYFGQSSFASRSIVAETSCVKVDPSYDLRRLGPLGCGIQTGAGAILNTLDVEAGSSVVIAGAGALGLSAVMAAKVAGATTIVAIDRHANRLELAERFGATATISAPPDQLAAAIRSATGGADYAFDTTGNASVVRALHDGLDKLGTLGMAGVGFGEVSFDFLSMINGRTITGVMEGDSTPREFIPHLAQLNADGRFPYHELLVEFPIEEINAAEAASAAGTVVKPVLVFPG